MAPERKHASDAILDAARSLLLDGGPRAATIAAIAGASGARRNAEPPLRQSRGDHVGDMAARDRTFP